VAWEKLTDNELLQTEGHAQKLTGLAQERYAISPDEADKQVKKFFKRPPLREYTLTPVAIASMTKGVWRANALDR
jgi:hypothetical protein